MNSTLTFLCWHRFQEETTVCVWCSEVLMANRNLLALFEQVIAERSQFFPQNRVLCRSVSVATNSLWSNTPKLLKPKFWYSYSRSVEPSHFGSLSFSGNKSWFSEAASSCRLEKLRKKGWNKISLQVPSTF